MATQNLLYINLMHIAALLSMLTSEKVFYNQTFFPVCDRLYFWLLASQKIKSCLTIASILLPTLNSMVKQ